jgi:two-component system, NarL family, competent response regulator ComA
MKKILVVEDDPDVQSLIKAIFSMDPRFSIARVVESAEEAIEAVGMTAPEIIVLDYNLMGELSGLDVAQQLKDLAPQTKIIMFTAHAEVEAQTQDGPTDVFLLKTESMRLLPLAQQMTTLMGFA